VTGVLYSCCGDQHRRNIVAFATEKHARGFLKLMKSTMATQKKQQEIKVSKISLPGLYRRCSMNALDLCLMTEDGEMKTLKYCDDPNDDIVFHLENVNLYY